MKSEISENIKDLISKKKTSNLSNIINELHEADIAEIIDGLTDDEALFLIKIIDKEKVPDVLIELDDSVRVKLLQNYSSKDIAVDIIDELDSDDAADIIGELPSEKKNQVISHIEDKESAQDIVDLLRYEDDVAGSIMAKEMVIVDENWTVTKCVSEMRKQAKDIEKIYSIYVVDKDEKLKGILSLKSLLTSSTKNKIKDLFSSNIEFVRAYEPIVEVTTKMTKYDLEAIPVVDVKNVLIGRITIDDVIDIIKEEADKDYQMASGISEDISENDSIFKRTKARLPWLLIGLAGGIFGARIIEGFHEALLKFPELLYFTPLIAATAGNIGVQSSAIVVQGLANNTFKGTFKSKIYNEFLLGLLNGISLSIILYLICVIFFDISYLLIVVVSISLFFVVINSALIGIAVPWLLFKKNIDPAIATGPFITTCNDIIGIIIYFYIAQLIL